MIINYYVIERGKFYNGLSKIAWTKKEKKGQLAIGWC